MSNRFGYTQARIQAHFAELPDENLWLHLGVLKEMASFLEEARSTSLNQWVGGLSASSDITDIDQYLQRRLIEKIGEISKWFDHQWRPSVLWLGTLVQIPHLDHLIRNQADPAGLISPELLDEPFHSASQQQGLWSAWIETWRNRWPRDTSRNLNSMKSLQALVEKHHNLFPTLEVSESWQARLDLETQLRLFFRRHTLQPGAFFAYIALLALALERLRSELIKRALLAPQAVL